MTRIVKEIEIDSHPRKVWSLIEKHLEHPERSPSDMKKLKLQLPIERNLEPTLNSTEKIAERLP